MSIRLLPVLLCAFLAVDARAQSPQRLLALTSSAPLLVKQDFGGNCATTFCNVAMPPLTGPWAGGCAFDANKGWVWVSTGGPLMAVDPLTCAVKCAPASLGLAGDITGLAVYEPKNLLIITTSSNIIYVANTVSSSGTPLCPPVLMYKCDANPIMPSAAHKIGGCSVDDVGGYFFFSASDFGIGAQASTIYVSDLSNIPGGSLCTPLCKVQVRDCGGAVMTAMTGIAYEPCKRLLFLTDGTRVRMAAIPNPLVCSPITQTFCCLPVLPAGETYVDLCVLPSEPTSLGTSCNAAPCAACPAMLHTTNWATIGGHFEFNLASAPTASNAYLLLGIGSCDPVGLPLLCAPIRTLPLATSLGPVPTGGSGACGGSVNLSFVLAPNPAWCGIILSSQFVTLCTGPGLGISNCVSTMITGS